VSNESGNIKIVKILKGNLLQPLTLANESYI